MKTKIAKSLILISLLTLSSWQAGARESDDDKGNNKDADYAYYIMSPKNWTHNDRDNDDDKWLRLFSKAGVINSVSFKGSIQIPETLRANTGLLRDGRSQALLIIDGRVQCTYEARLNRKFFNAMYGFVSCTDGSRVGENVRVDTSVGVFLKDVKGTPATIYASIKISEKYSRGIKLPQLEASKGQILRFDGDLWVPSNYIPDGQAAGEVLLWDGSTWMAAKLNNGGAGSVGPAGPQGIQGPAGADGLQGPQGPKGDTGLQGLIGPAGANGVNGSNGAQGLQGIQGPKGDIGLQGLTGPAGVNGVNGSNGAQGLQGPQGLTGAKGDKGDAGIAGPQGLQGLNGANGAQGAQGIQGLKGDTGEKGDKGDPGLVSLTAGNGILGGTILGNGGTIAVNTGTAAGQIPVIDANGKLPASIIALEAQKIVYIKDVKANAVNGGTCDSTKLWDQVRDLNSLNGDTSFVSLANNQFTLAAGTYTIEANAPAYLDGFHKAALVNTATSEFVLVGSNGRSHNVAGGMEPSVIMGQVVLAAPTTFAIKHRCGTTMANVGFGTAVGFGVEEVYTQVKIVKLK